MIYGYSIVISILLACCCLIGFGLSRYGFVERLYGFLDLEIISRNKKILSKELDFVNKSINNLSKLALSAVGVILGGIFLFKDEILKILKISISEFVVLQLVCILIVYLIIYCIEIKIKTNYKKEI